MDGMKTTIDSAGRIVIPKVLRQEAGLEPGREVEIRLRNGVVEIEPTPLEVRVEKRGAFTIAVPARGVPSLTGGTVDETLRQIRGERGTEA